MILFYAQSGNNEIVVTSPKLTFPGIATDPRMYGVQPVRYTTLDGKNHEFKNTDIEKFVYLPKNNGHNVFRIRFSKTFEGRDGCTITLRAGFSQNRFQTFTLPFTVSTTLEATASTEPLTISVSAKGSRLPATSYKAYVNSSIVGSPISTTSAGASIDTNDYKEAASGVLEIVGATVDQGTAPIDIRELNRLMSAERTKFLSSSVFYDPAQEVSKYASYFYIYAEECDKEASDTIEEDCFDDNADNTGTGTIRLNNNSCTYARRAPNNVTIEHIPGGKVANATVKYIEENLPQDTDPINDITDFDGDSPSVTTVVAGSGVTNGSPSLAKFNLDGDNATVVFEWTDIDTDSEFVSPMYDLQDKSVINTSTQVNSSDDNRLYYFALFRTASAGCIDSTAINYDSSAIRDDGSCVFCDDIIGQVSGAFTFKPSATTSAITEDNDDDTNFALNTTIKNPGSSLVTYLGTQASTVWTANIYKSEDVSLNDYGEQATVGTPVINNASLGGNKGSATLPQFQKPPTASSGLNSGRSFVVELILTLGGCVHYFYQPFAITFDGCTDPAATNYSPNRLNTGRGNCNYDASNRSTCDGLIQYEESGLWPQGSTGSFIVQLTILGTFDENGDEIPGSGAYTLEAYTFLQSTGEEVDLDVNSVSAGSVNFLVEEGEILYLTITDTATGCFASYTFINPNTGVVLGCTDPTAENYDPDATENDGSCLYCTDIALTVIQVKHPKGTCTESDNDGSIKFRTEGTAGSAYTIFYNGPTPGSGYTALDPGSLNTGAILGPGVYDAFVIVTLSPDYSCTIPLSGGPVNLSVDTSGCGCTNPEADNYDPSATEDDGSCIIPGCTNSLAINYNPGATYDDGTCVYSADAETPLCIPNALDNNQQYEDFLNGLKNCIINEGSTLLLKTRGGIKCDTVEQVKLSLISYLLNRIGLECMYNCNYTFEHGDVAVDCKARWKAGGPSGGEKKWSDNATLINGDIFSYETLSGDTQYWEVIGGDYTTGVTPPVPPNLRLCTNVTLPSGSETYLNTFINFARKFCTVCIVEPMAQSTTMQAIATTLTDIQLENGDNIEL